MADALKYTLAKLPTFSNIDDATIVCRLQALLDQQRQRLAALLAEIEQPDWDNLIAPLEEMADEVRQFWSPIGHLHNVADREALRTAHNEAVALLSEYATELAQNQALYECHVCIQDSAAFNDFDAARKKVIENALRDFRLGGISLPEDAQKKVKALSIELAQLGARFQENVLDSTQAFKLEVKERERLAGLPESALALARQNAERADVDGWILTLDFPSYVPSMTYLDDHELRAELYEAYTTRASECGPDAGRHDNSTVMAEIMAKRRALGREIGFDNYAEYSLATKMARSTDEVLAFLYELSKRARPAAEREFDELQAFAQTLGVAQPEAWDIAYYSEKLRQKQFSFSAEDVKPYFPVTRVIDGMFEVARRLFGIEITCTEKVDLWHEDVRFFTVSDEHGGALGFFYLDLYARDGKRGGAWMDECLVRWDDSYGRQLPVAYLTCNFTPPVAGQPTLLTHNEVTTLFHEFGHGLHHMLTEIDRPAVSGINGVPWDAVELPSQFLENWCWERDALDFVSGHHDDGRPLPDDLFQRMRAAKNFQAAMQMVRQLEFALFDFRLHLEYTDGLSVQGLLDDVRREAAVIIPPANNRFQHSFAHVFGGGYAAGYYSYKWAEVLSADAFSRFEAEGIFNRSTGRDFQTTILEKGGSEDAMVLFRAFRGREPDIEPLLRRAGLIA